MKKKSMLDGFSFAFSEGTERRGVADCDNVIWDNGKVCIALLYEDGINKFRLDYGDERSECAAGFSRKHSELFNELDPILIRCIALQWVTHGGNIGHD